MRDVLINRIREKMEVSFEKGGHKLMDTHFENGRNLHSEQYYYAKRYFQKTKNCDEIAELLSLKLTELKLPTSTTLIGFRNYTGLVLNKTIAILGSFNYAIIEFDENFIWQYLPILKENLVIVLPITCTCSTYVKLRKFLLDFISNRKIKGVTVNDNFINVFLILEQSVENLKLPCEIRSLPKKGDTLLPYNIYSAFNWVEITNDTIIFNNKTSNTFTAHPLVRLYSKMHLPESCEICFPSKLINEKFLFPTHDNYETPNLIFGFPNFTNITKRQNFYESFSSSSTQTSNTLWNIHLYGHTVVNGSSYMSYIRGDEFYKKNKEAILDYFSKELEKRLSNADLECIFITPESNHSSNFIEDICLRSPLKEKSITILRFDPSNEFIDNFISLHGEIFNSKYIKVIFFEEVISAAKTFKLLSDYIKHSRKSLPEVTIRHGFDLAITLVDRTLLFTRDEITKKLYSSINNKSPENNLISYFKLNAPIVSALHMRDPLNQRENDLKGMENQCHLDFLKIYINKLIEKERPINLEELESISQENLELNFFPFKNLEKYLDKSTYFYYYPHFNKNQSDLLKLNLVHELNCELSDDKYQNLNFLNQFLEPSKLIEHLVVQVFSKIMPNLVNYFGSYQKDAYKYRDVQGEFEIIHDFIIKILTRHPFIYYKTLYEAIFKYCINKLNNFFSDIEMCKISDFDSFRKLKFYIRRSIELNSNFIISPMFIGCIKTMYAKNSVRKVLDFYTLQIENLQDILNNEIADRAFYLTCIKNLTYQEKQVFTYSTFLLYCYKELIYKNPHRSIKLEGLINSTELLPKQIIVSDDSDGELESLIMDPYYHFTEMLKLENIYLLNELKNLHKERGKLYEWSKSDHPEIFSVRSLYDYHFRMKKNNPIIVNAKKLIAQSRLRLITKDRTRVEKLSEIKTAVCEMLCAVSLLESKKSRNQNGTLSNKEKDLKEIFDAILKVLQPGIAKDSLTYAFFVEYRHPSNENRNLDNIYTILSTEDVDNPETVSLSKNGLIYNLLYGLYDATKSKNEQSLIASLKLSNDKFISFNTIYSYVSNDKKELVEENFSEFYRNDHYDFKTGHGLKLLEDANMSLAFRFSEFLKPNESVSPKHLRGQAVLLVMNSEECKTSNFLNFASNEKVRLLLLIKKEILEYLKKWFDNDVFIEIIEKRKKIVYQRHLRHGLNQYIEAQSRLLEKIWKGVNAIENKEVFNIVTDALRGQLKATKLIDTYKKVVVTREKLIRKVELIVESEILGVRPIKFSEMDLSKFDFESLEMHPTIFDVVIPELIINMKKYSPLVGAKGLAMEYQAIENCLVLKNYINPNLSNEDYGGGEGLKMCHHILCDILKVGDLVIYSQGNDHVVTLKF